MPRWLCLSAATARRWSRASSPWTTAPLTAPSSPRSSDAPSTEVRTDFTDHLIPIIHSFFCLTRTDQQCTNYYYKHSTFSNFATFADAVTAVDSGKRALEILGSVTALLPDALFACLCLDFHLADEHCLFLCTIQEPNVSMIITDYWMPEMTGYDLLKKVKVINH